MPRTAPFEHHPLRYELWFERNRFAYLSEIQALRAVRQTFPRRGLEIGVGSARFAIPLGFRYGVEPAEAMTEISARRGIFTIRGIAEQLPFREGMFDQALMVTTVCFVDDLLISFLETRRILMGEGLLLVGFIDRDSSIGRAYEAGKSQNDFYREATFHTTEEVLEILGQAGFSRFTIAQTLFQPPQEMTQPDPVRIGHGTGSFVAICARS